MRAKQRSRVMRAESFTPRRMLKRRPQRMQNPSKWTTQMAKRRVLLAKSKIVTGLRSLCCFFKHVALIDIPLARDLIRNLQHTVVSE